MTRDVEPGTCTRAHIDTPESIDSEHPAARVADSSRGREGRGEERERERRPEFTAFNIGKMKYGRGRA